VSTITTIVVFMPTVFLEGQAKLLFIPLTFTISCSLFASFLVSRTVTPLLCLHWLRAEAPVARRNLYTRALEWSGRMLGRLDEEYQRALGWALGHPKTLIGGMRDKSLENQAQARERAEALRSSLWTSSGFSLDEAHLSP
jgi:multidrug efflux pump subunit AcrB